jgi:putative membrane protein
LAALAIALATPAARAQQPTPGNAPVNDALFAEAAADSGLAEVTLSDLGLRKATDPELKKFSQQMIDDHNRLNSELTTLAAQKRLALPRVVDARARFCAQSLSGLSGETFDRCYAKAQWVAHMEAVATFEAEAERGQDADLRAFASRALPRIKEHLKTIKPIAMKYEKEDRSEPAK